MLFWSLVIPVVRYFRVFFSVEVIDVLVILAVSYKLVISVQGL